MAKQLQRPGYDPRVGGVVRVVQTNELQIGGLRNGTRGSFQGTNHIEDRFPGLGSFRDRFIEGIESIILERTRLSRQIKDRFQVKSAAS